MIRIVSTFCVGLLGFTIISAYHVSEQARVTRQELRNTEKQIRQEQTDLSVLEVQWERVANPATVQKLAEAQLGMQGASTVQLASVTLLPRKSDALNGEEMQQASATALANRPSPVVKIAAHRGM